MIKRITKQDRAKALEYLHTIPVNALPICEGMKYYGLEGSEDFALYGDFWVDGEIKCLFAKVDQVVYIYSNSPSVETMSVYTFLRDNYVPYTTIIGQEDKVRGYQRHILFKERNSHHSLVLSKRNLVSLNFSRQKAELITPGVVDEVVQFINSSPDFVAHPVNAKAVLKYTERYGGYYVRARGKVVSVGIATANIRKLLYLGILVTEDTYKADYGYTEMVATKVAQGGFEAGYTGVCVDNISKGYESACKKLGFEASTQNIQLKR